MLWWGPAVKTLLGNIPKCDIVNKKTMTGEDIETVSYHLLLPVWCSEKKIHVFHINELRDYIKKCEILGIKVKNPFDRDLIFSDETKNTVRTLCGETNNDNPRITRSRKKRTLAEISTNVENFTAR
jgi:hypothetical protein